MFGAEAAAFIAKHREQPWFVYLAFNAVHMPLQAPGEYRKRFASIKTGNRRSYAAMQLAMDDAVGVVLDTVRQAGQEDNTLVFFLSDNGGPTAATTSSNLPLRGGKTQVWEGGIRVPFLVRWSGRIPAGKVYDRPVSSLDILPTALEAAGIPGDEALEGVNLLPYLNGEKSGLPNEALFWRYGEKRAVRMGDWKLTDMGEGWKLYNLAEDIGEEKDLSRQESERCKALDAAYTAWDGRNIQPRWLHKGASSGGEE
jgi:arylsulfatase A-like enzyme